MCISKFSAKKWPENQEYSPNIRTLWLQKWPFYTYFSFFPAIYRKSAANQNFGFGPNFPVGVYDVQSIPIAVCGVLFCSLSKILPRRIFNREQNNNIRPENHFYTLKAHYFVNLRPIFTCDT